jgi:sulfatase maturation enzyme AslB (radical SAM superfamily)
LIDFQTIYLQPEVMKYARGREILDAYPAAERTLVDSHWKIPGLYGYEGNIDDWINIKRNVLVLGIKSSLSARPNTRSSDFVAPSNANGCSMACSYCYVPRRKGFANPITEFINIEQIVTYTRRHALRQGLKPAEPDRPQVLPECVIRYSF